MFDCVIDVQEIVTTNDFVKAAITQLCKVFTNFLSDELKEVHHKLRLACEACTKFRVLCCNTNRAGVEVTHTHHDAARDNQWRGCETKLFSTQESSNDNVAAGLELTIHLNGNAVTHTVEHESLLRFSKTQLPRRSSVLERVQWASTCTTVVT